LPLPEPAAAAVAWRRNEPEQHRGDDMKTNIVGMSIQLAALTVGFAFTLPCFAGQPVKWQDVPETVRATILANGGIAGQAVDLESGKKNGKKVYEAGVKDKDGTTADLVVTEDGKLIETKQDDAADRAQELAAQAKKVKKVPTGPRFSHPRDITNPYLPLAYLKQDILEGTEGSKKVRVERTLKPDLRKSFKLAGQTIEALAMEDREFEDGVLAEVALDYFAQDDEGTVYYLGEDVDEYENGKVTGHSGAWMLGKDTPKPGIIIPAHPKVGDRFKSEDVSKDISEDDEVVSVSETVSVPAGTYENCVQIKEHLADGSTEFKYYAPGVGVVRELPASGDLPLKSHTARSGK
jgi:hypothetical protein